MTTRLSPDPETAERQVWLLRYQLHVYRDHPAAADHVAAQLQEALREREDRTGAKESER
jgi:hypothetical protein